MILTITCHVTSGPRPGVEMAVKRMIVTVDDRERKTLQMDVTVIMKAECPYIVKFYGALFREGEVG